MKQNADDILIIICNEKMTLFFCIFFFSIFAYSLFYILPEGYHENKDKLNDIDIYICEMLFFYT